jgi:hypothetical protein
LGPADFLENTMFRATRTFEFDGEPFLAGVTFVADHHPARRAHPERFAPDNSSPGSRMRSAVRSTDPDGHLVDDSERFRTEEDRQRAIEQARIRGRTA